MLETNNIAVLANRLKELVSSDRASDLKKKMKQGVDYYLYQHDILSYRIFYYDQNDILREGTHRSNRRIPHGFFAELVDQKVQYMLSNPIEITTEQEGLQGYLGEYIDEDFQLMLQEAVEGASQKSVEYIFWKKDVDGRLRFKTADAMKVIPIYDAFFNIIQIVYYYSDNIIVDNKQKTVTKIQLWTSEEVFYFIDVDGKSVELDQSVKVNPAPHEQVELKGQLFGKGYGQVPFLVLENNRQKTTDLEPIKELIDDYDLMACALSNNLVDFDHPIFAVKGYDAENMDKALFNINSKKAIELDDDGELEVKTVTIPVEARKEKLAIDKEAIYKFGMGFDSSQVGDGNITNVVIKSRYTLLDLKCNKIEVRLRALLKQMLELIVDNINELYSKNYTTDDIEITITRDVMANEIDNATIAKTEADTKQVLINNIMTAAPRLDDRTVLELLANILEVDADDVDKALEEQGYADDMEVEDDGAEQVPEGDREPSNESGQEDNEEAS